MVIVFVSATIGIDTVIEAGAAVAKEVPEYNVVGNPGIVVGLRGGESK